MRELFEQAAIELERDEPVVLATVVRTKGSTPQKPGAKLLVRKDGSGYGTLGGGCVEGDIWFAANQLLQRKGVAEYREYQLNEDLAAEDGLVCGGTMYFLVDPIYRSCDYLSIANAINQAYQGGEPVALATVIRTTDTGPQVGSKMFIRGTEDIQGSLGNPKLDLEATNKARELMIYGRNEFVSTDAGIDYFIETYTTPPQLVICGGGHVSQAIAPLAHRLGFRLFITDDREEFANTDRFPYADIIIVDKPEDALPQLPINPNTFIVVATRGHRFDGVALLAAANTLAKYVGLLGSKRKTILIYEDLMRAGLPMERLKEIRSPIGLDIHARTPDEIAFSIMSEVLMFRLGGTGLPMKLDDNQIDRIQRKIGAVEVAVRG